MGEIGQPVREEPLQVPAPAPAEPRREEVPPARPREPERTPEKVPA